MRDRNPAFDIDGTAVILDTPTMAAFPTAELRQPVLSLRPPSDVIVSALETLFGSY